MELILLCLLKIILITFLKFLWKPVFNPLACCKERGQMLKAGEVGIKTIKLRFTLGWQVVSEELIDPNCSGECQIKKVWCVQGGVLMSSIMLEPCLLNYKQCR